MKKFENPLGFATSVGYLIIGLITYIINVVDTWRSGGSAILNIVVNLTLDAVLAVMWPIAWILWTFHHVLGRSSPLDWLFR